MSIKEFEYLDVAIAKLEDKYDDLEELSVVIQDNFFEILKENSIEFLNISARVKSPESLKEKILRNKYYKRYPDGNKLIYNLSDLIGVRIECRFADDERNIYRFFKKYFNKNSDGNYYYNENDDNFYLKLEGKQPQKQKNGFTIYRIDGKYVFNGNDIPFELQIKSLVNMFWGEIEHEIIYKNSNYIIENNFLKDIMGSIKNNLSMIDKQLVTVFNHFETKKKTDSDSRKKHLENIVSKIIYDLFANKMKNSIGMTVDFKKSCETIIRYAFVSEDYESEDKYTEVLIKALTRLSEITNESIDFNSDIMFERKIKFEDEFTKRLGEYFQSVINNEFSWNLFFRILFTLEPLNNAGDFEKFLEFLRVNFIESKYISKQKEVLKEKFKERYIEIENAITLQTVESLIDVDKIDIVYDYNIYDINDEVEDIYREISNNISSIDQWEKESVRILDKLDAEIKDIFA